MTAVSWSVALVARTAGFALAWWAVSEGDLSMARYGAVAVVIAVAVSLLMWRPGTIAPRTWSARSLAGVRLFGWFLWRSVVGGSDVALRAVRRPVDIAPGFVEHRLRIASPAGRVAVGDLLNLMPGSLSTELVGERVRIHVIDVDLPVARTVEELEERVAAVIGE